MPDLHCPFQNQKLVRKILKALSTVKLSGLIIGGDFADCFSLSKFVAGSLNNLKDITLEYEYRECNKLLDQIDSICNKGVKKYYLYGNHESRYFSTIDRADNAKYGSALKSPTEALRLHERKYAVYEDWTNDFVRLGKSTSVIHGLYCNANPAVKHFQMFPTETVVFGHTHRIQSVVASNHSAYNIGCLADINSKAFNYRNRVDKQLWSSGFAMITIDTNGNSFVETIRVNADNNFVMNGKIY
jgi:predicted phosphodiesterase